MHPAVALALKDLRILTRIPGAFFFTFIWPLLVAVFFGTIFGSPSRATPTLPIAVVDEDASAEAKAFVDGLAKRGAFDVLRVSRADATTLVKQGKRVAAVIVPSGFGPASRRVFQGAAPQVEIAIDPSRQAESAMLQGLLMAQAGERLQSVLNDPSQGRAAVADSLRTLQQAPGGLATSVVPVERFLKELDTFLETQQKQQASGGQAPGAGWKPLEVKVSSVAKDDSGPKSGYDITFPQGLLWGIIGCTMSFAVSLATERNQGTMTRLRMSPAPASTLLLGKALACYLTILIVEALLVAIGTLLLGLRIGSPVLFALAALVAPLGFVGIMMLISALLRSEQAGGVGWAIMMPLAMIGGVMIPLIAMPPWLLSLSNISPMKWAILSYEGAIWRGFSFGEMVQPLGILLAVGLITFAIGSRILGRMAERI